MRAIVFATALDAEAFADKLATDAGMPWVGGTRVGGGVHAPPEQCRTERVADPVVAADAKTAAVVLEDATVDAVTKDDAPLALGKADVKPDGTWNAKSVVALVDAAVAVAEEPVP